jgi:hypothetical protein
MNTTIILSSASYEGTFKFRPVIGRTEDEKEEYKKQAIEISSKEICIEMDAGDGEDSRGSISLGFACELDEKHDRFIDAKLVAYLTLDDIRRLVAHLGLLLQAVPTVS